MATYSNRDRPVQSSYVTGAAVAAVTVPVDFNVCRIWRFTATIISAGASDLVLRPNDSTATAYGMREITNGVFASSTGDWIVARIGAAAQVTRLAGKIISVAPPASNRKTLYCDAIRDADQDQHTLGDWSATVTITSLTLRALAGSLINVGSQFEAWPENVNLTNSLT